jgi:hypothetical protein
MSSLGHLQPLAGIMPMALALILLQKSFGGDERNFLGPLMRFVRSDVTSLLIRNTTTELRIGATEYCSGGVA